MITKPRLERMKEAMTGELVRQNQHQKDLHDNEWRFSPGLTRAVGREPRRRDTKTWALHRISEGRSQPSRQWVGPSRVTSLLSRMAHDYQRYLRMQEAEAERRRELERERERGGRGRGD
jgi:hypothetical protein